ncbi:hypothetical protein BC940DRAFT_311498 [Gongronella butleri]|nr:hypothetical protein BC940DRAFT_311498 [Gongronella butleri]
MVVQSLYTLSLHKLLQHGLLLSSLDGVALSYVTDMLALLQKDRLAQKWPLVVHQHLLRVISKSHGPKLAQLYPWMGAVYMDVTYARAMLKSYSCVVPSMITTLSLVNSCFDDDDVILLQPMTHLRILDLSNTRIGNLGVLYLAGKGMPSLHLVSLRYNRQINDGALRHLLAMPSIHGLDLSYTGVTRSVAIAALKKDKYVLQTPKELDARKKTISASPHANWEAFPTTGRVNWRQIRSETNDTTFYWKHTANVPNGAHDFFLINHKQELGSHALPVIVNMLDGTPNLGNKIEYNHYLACIIRDIAREESPMKYNRTKQRTQTDHSPPLVFLRPSLATRQAKRQLRDDTSAKSPKKRPTLQVKKTQDLASFLDSLLV